MNDTEVIVRNAVKLCRDCKHYVPANETCLKSPKPINFITGEEGGFYQAQIERETFAGCSVSGRKWEAK